ncbi:MAG: ABC transporter ATP-binding protein [Clostridia bacterium]|nr:ABC transporter ATP-binding protein [Clostridia bacterium]
MLEFRNVTKKYLRRTALDDVSFSIPAGRICLMLGPNGSGKTTSMKLIAGLSRQSSGEVLFDGSRIGAKTKAKIAYMPTENYFYDYMTVADAGRYYADFFRDFQRGAFDGWLKRMELRPEDRVRQLSSGMAAKLRLALILSRDAKLMMFDEPLNGVDILTRQQVIDAILTARSPERTLLISTHLVDELEDVVDTCVFLKEGRLAAAGTREETCGDRTLKERYIEIYGHVSEEVAAHA